jgi:hypothetical protein
MPMSDDTEIKEKLTGPWKQIQGAIWLIGLAILFWKGWWWPGILVVAAISGLFEAFVRLVIKPQTETEAPQMFSTPSPDIETQSNSSTASYPRLPARCPTCGAPINNEIVHWSDDHQNATCPYCSSNVTSS